MPDSTDTAPPPEYKVYRSRPRLLQRGGPAFSLRGAYNMVRELTEGVVIGPILMGVAKPAHVLTSSSTVRRVVNMTAIACVEAQVRSGLTQAVAPTI